MLIGTVSGAIVDFLQHRESKADIEQELNAQFNGRRFSVSTYQNVEINLIVDAIHARPKFAPTEEAEGIARVEADHFFTQLETERTDPTLKERLRARILAQWITTVRLTIENGDADSIRPPGLNLGYIAVTTAMRYQGYDQSSRSVTPISPIRVVDTHDLQSDKLEIKIRHDGPVGNYAERITDSIALLQEIQDNMQYYATRYLLEFHDSGKDLTGGEFTWPNKERAQNLSEYLFGHPIELNELENIVSELKADISHQE